MLSSPKILLNKNTNEIQKCGEIWAAAKFKVFSMVCSYCQAQFTIYQDFLKHLQLQHCDEFIFDTRDKDVKVHARENLMTNTQQTLAKDNVSKESGWTEDDEHWFPDGDKKNDDYKCNFPNNSILKALEDCDVTTNLLENLNKTNCAEQNDNILSNTIFQEIQNNDDKFDKNLSEVAVDISLDFDNITMTEPCITSTRNEENFHNTKSTGLKDLLTGLDDLQDLDNLLENFEESLIEMPNENNDTEVVKLTKNTKPIENHEQLLNLDTNLTSTDAILEEPDIVKNDLELQIKNSSIYNSCFKSTTLPTNFEDSIFKEETILAEGSELKIKVLGDTLNQQTNTFFNKSIENSKKNILNNLINSNSSIETTTLPDNLKDSIMTQTETFVQNLEEPINQDTNSLFNNSLKSTNKLEKKLKESPLKKTLNDDLTKALEEALEDDINFLNLDAEVETDSSLSQDLKNFLAQVLMEEEIEPELNENPTNTTNSIIKMKDKEPLINHKTSPNLTSSDINEEKDKTGQGNILAQVLIEQEIVPAVNKETTNTTNSIIKIKNKEPSITPEVINPLINHNTSPNLTSSDIKEEKDRTGQENILAQVLIEQEIVPAVNRETTNTSNFFIKIKNKQTSITPEIINPLINHKTSQNLTSYDINVEKDKIVQHTSFAEEKPFLSSSSESLPLKPNNFNFKTQILTLENVLKSIESNLIELKDKHVDNSFSSGSLKSKTPKKSDEKLEEYVQTNNNKNISSNPESLKSKTPKKSKEKSEDFNLKVNQKLKEENPNILNDKPKDKLCSTETLQSKTPKKFKEQSEDFNTQYVQKHNRRNIKSKTPKKLKENQQIRTENIKSKTPNKSEENPQIFTTNIKLQKTPVKENPAKDLTTFTTVNTKTDRIKSKTPKKSEENSEILKSNITLRKTSVKANLGNDLTTFTALNNKPEKIKSKTPKKSKENSEILKSNITLRKTPVKANPGKDLTTYTALNNKPRNIKSKTSKKSGENSEILKSNITLRKTPVKANPAKDLTKFAPVKTNPDHSKSKTSKKSEENSEILKSNITLRKTPVKANPGKDLPTYTALNNKPRNMKSKTPKKSGENSEILKSLRKTSVKANPGKDLTTFTAFNNKPEKIKSKTPKKSKENSEILKSNITLRKTPVKANPANDLTSSTALNNKPGNIKSKTPKKSQENPDVFESNTKLRKTPIKDKSSTNLTKLTLDQTFINTERGDRTPLKPEELLFKQCAIVPNKNDNSLEIFTPPKYEKSLKTKEKMFLKQINNMQAKNEISTPDISAIKQENPPKTRKAKALQLGLKSPKKNEPIARNKIQQTLKKPTLKSAKLRKSKVLKQNLKSPKKNVSLSRNKTLKTFEKPNLRSVKIVEKDSNLKQSKLNLPKIQPKVKKQILTTTHKSLKDTKTIYPKLKNVVVKLQRITPDKLKEMYNVLNITTHTEEKKSSNSLKKDSTKLLKISTKAKKKESALKRKNLPEKKHFIKSKEDEETGSLLNPKNIDITGGSPLKMGKKDTIKCPITITKSEEKENDSTLSPENKHATDSAKSITKPKEKDSPLKPGNKDLRESLQINTEDSIKFPVTITKSEEKENDSTLSPENKHATDSAKAVTKPKEKDSSLKPGNKDLKGSLQINTEDSIKFPVTITKSEEKENDSTLSPENKHATDSAKAITKPKETDSPLKPGNKDLRESLQINTEDSIKFPVTITKSEEKENDSTLSPENKHTTDSAKAITKPKEKDSSLKPGNKDLKESLQINTEDSIKFPVTITKSEEKEHDSILNPENKHTTDSVKAITKPEEKNSSLKPGNKDLKESLLINTEDSIKFPVTITKSEEKEHDSILNPENKHTTDSAKAITKPKEKEKDSPSNLEKINLTESLQINAKANEKNSSLNPEHINCIKSPKTNIKDSSVKEENKVTLKSSKTNTKVKEKVLPLNINKIEFLKSTKGSENIHIIPKKSLKSKTFATGRKRKASIDILPNQNISSSFSTKTSPKRSNLNYKTYAINRSACKKQILHEMPHIRQHITESTEHVEELTKINVKEKINIENISILPRLPSEVMNRLTYNLQNTLPTITAFTSNATLSTNYINNDFKHSKPTMETPTLDDKMFIEKSLKRLSSSPLQDDGQLTKIPYKSPRKAGNSSNKTSTKSNENSRVVKEELIMSPDIDSDNVVDDLLIQVINEHKVNEEINTHKSKATDENTKTIDLVNDFDKTADLNLLNKFGLNIIKSPNIEDIITFEEIEEMNGKAKQFAEILKNYELIWNIKNILNPDIKLELVKSLQQMLANVNQIFNFKLNMIDIRRLVNLINCWYGHYCNSQLMDKDNISEGTKHYLLMFHYLPQTSKRFYYCEYCDEFFTVERDYFTHRAVHIGDQHPFKCFICLIGFKFLKHQKLHLQNCAMKSNRNIY